MRSKRDVNTMNKKLISIVTYGTIAILGILIFILMLNTAWSNLSSSLYFLLGMIVYTVILAIIYKLLSSVGMYATVGVTVIILVHIQLNSWLFTVILSCLTGLLLFLYYKEEKTLTWTILCIWHLIFV